MGAFCLGLGWGDAVDALKCPCERRWGTVSIFQRHVNDFCAPLQIKGSFCHFPAADIFRKGHICQIGKHTLKMEGCTAGGSGNVIQRNFRCQAFFQHFQGFIPFVYPVHVVSSLFVFVNDNFSLP